MGEAKRRAAAAASAHDVIDRRLRELGVDTQQFGFYDQPAFIEQEARNRAFLEQYALWVNTRPRTAAYDDRARRIVPALATFLADLFERQGMQRSCVHASAMMPRILDRLGVWSFGLKGSMIAEVPSADLWRGQTIHDFADFPGAELGHAWVVAPPFVVVDPTIRLQNPEADEMNRYLPRIVASDEAEIVRPRIDDVVSAELRADFARREGRVDPQLHHRLEPTLRAFSREFPTRQIVSGELVLRYVPSGVRISDMALEQINGRGDRLTGAEVWERYVAPAFSEFIV
jgi:hypothetical protein